MLYQQLEIMKENHIVFIHTESSTHKEYTIRLVNLKVSDLSENTIKIDGNDTLISCVGNQNMTLRLS